MGLKRTYTYRCERCGKVQLKFTSRNTFWLYHDCDNPIPGPHCPPSEHRIADVLLNDEAMQAMNTSSTATHPK